LTWIRAPLTVGATPIDGLRLVAHDGLRVAGRLQFARGSSLPGPEGLAGIHLNLASRDQRAQATVTRDGTFVFDGLVAGAYSVFFEESTWFVVSAASRGMIAGPIALDEDIADLVITATDHPTEISGTVEPINDMYPAMVVLLPATLAALPGGLWEGTYRATIEPDHRFTLKALPAGDYIAAALLVADARRGGHDLNVLGAIRAQGTPVSLGENALRVVTLKPVVVR
jgi:hypothetical protein